MLGVGFIGTGSAHHRGRAGENGAKSITATVLPASSPLAVGETLADTVDWAVQYSTDEGGSWRRLCNRWVQAVHNIMVASDGTAIAAGKYSLRIRYRTDTISQRPRLLRLLWWRSHKEHEK